MPYFAKVFRAEVIKDFLNSNKRELAMWTLIIVLTTIKIYQGDQSFYVDKINQSLPPGPELDWMRWLYHHLASLLLWAFIPFLIIKLGFKEKLSQYAWRLGDWKFGVKATLAAMIIMPIPVYFSSLNPEHREWYPLTTLAVQSVGYFALWGLCYLPHYIGWEFFFRGFIGVGLSKFYGKIGATGIQVAMTVLLHLNKPMGETWGAAVGGVYLGWLTYRTGSVWWAILFHFYLGMLNTWMCG